MIRQTIVTLVLLLLLGTAALAQSTPAPASLIADEITVDPEGKLTANGNVEVYFDGARLTATQVAYDQSSDRLTINGPITLRDADGTIFLADAATLSSDLKDGLLVSARLVLERQLQLAAAEIHRQGERYTQLSRVIASSCEVCAANSIPLWEIRARRVVHDTLERQLYFDNAQVRVIGIPVFFLPRLRLPDPTLERARGFLIPEVRQSSDLGLGVAAPYFIPIGNHADLTFTPYLSSSTDTLEVDYRHQLSFGYIDAEAAVTNDDIEGRRGYLFGTAVANLPRDYRALLSLELVSDPGYLFTYGYSEADRLQSELRLDRVRDKDLFLARIVDFRTLRASEIPIEDTLPDILGEVSYLREFPSLSFGGQTFGSLRAATLSRRSGEDILGRDVRRIGAEIDWRRDWVWRNGMVFAAEAGLAADAYNVSQDSNFETNTGRIAPRAAAELRWPMTRTTQDGGSEVLEPVIRLDMADVNGSDVPLEDSLVVEFDEGNLFSHTRFAGVDGIEDDSRLSLGASWRRIDPDGWDLDVALGRLIALDGDLGFAEGTGLTGDQSEWLASARYSRGSDFALTTRSLFDNDLTFTLSETRIDWHTERYQIGSTYLFAEPEPAEDRLDRLSEFAFDGVFNLNPQWKAGAEFRYDLNEDQAARSRVSLEYANECILLSLSVSRRFASSSSVTPTTDIGLRVSLIGVGGTVGATPRSASCRG